MTGGVRLDRGYERSAAAPERILDFDLSAELSHGMRVSNLAYAVAKELGMDDHACY